MSDIASSVAALLHIQMPNGCVGKPITEVIRQVFPFSIGIKRDNYEFCRWKSNSFICFLLYPCKTKQKVKIMITVSPAAKEYITKLMTDKHATSETFVRVGVKSGGCSGLEYKLDFDTVQKEGDQIFEDKGITVVVDMKSLLYLYGTELDYSGGLNGKGLTFNNPNASRTCSCGESFAV